MWVLMKHPNPNLIKVTVYFMWSHAAVIDGNRQICYNEPKSSFLHTQINYRQRGPQNPK